MVMDNFSKYESMRDKGASPKEVYRAAKADSLDPITVLRLLRRVFSLSLSQAKEVTVIAEGLANSLEEHQEKLLPGLEQALAHTEGSQSPNGAASETASAQPSPARASRRNPMVPRSNGPRPQITP
jgi:hypothetical protein